MATKQECRQPKQMRLIILDSIGALQDNLVTLLQSGLSAVPLDRLGLLIGIKKLSSVFRVTRDDVLWPNLAIS